MPTPCSWFNLVERWFRNLTQQRLRRGSFRNVKELVQAIGDYISRHNQNPRVFVWSASVERILPKVATCKEALDAPLSNLLLVKNCKGSVSSNKQSSSSRGWCRATSNYIRN